MTEQESHFVMHQGNCVAIDLRSMRTLKLTNGQEIDVYMLRKVFEENLKYLKDDMKASAQSH
jgi:hypothetical protein